MTSEATPIHPLLAAARAALPDVVEIRRRLHRRPEIGLQLPGTQAMVSRSCARSGSSAGSGGTTDSVTAVIEGARPGPTILLRADMDGLPLTEETGLEFASETPARCTPAATTPTWRCCWEPRACSWSGGTRWPDACC